MERKRWGVDVLGQRVRGVSGIGRGGDRGKVRGKGRGGGGRGGQRGEWG